MFPCFAPSIDGSVTQQRSPPVQLRAMQQEDHGSAMQMLVARLRLAKAERKSCPQQTGDQESTSSSSDEDDDHGMQVDGGFNVVETPAEKKARISFARAPTEQAWQEGHEALATKLKEILKGNDFREGPDAIHWHASQQRNL